MNMSILCLSSIWILMLPWLCLLRVKCYSNWSYFFFFFFLIGVFTGTLHSPVFLVIFFFFLIALYCPSFRQWHIQTKFGHSSFKKTGGHLGGWVGGGCCEPPVGLGHSTGQGPGSFAVFLIQNTSFILNLIISVMLIIQYLKQTSFNNKLCHQPRNNLES